VRFWEINSGIERQQVAQHLPLFLIGCAGAAFPSQNQRRFDPHFTPYLIGMKPLFVALGLNVITKRFYDSRDVLSAVAIRRNVGAGYANLPLCKSQQGYSPPGEGIAVVRFLFCERPSSKSSHRCFSESADDSPSPWGEDRGEGGFNFSALLKSLSRLTSAATMPHGQTQLHRTAGLRADPDFGFDRKF